MIIYPAIDLRQGRCVRLQQGNAAAETVFADDPLDAALAWVNAGAQWLHMVNLDGALGQSAEANIEALKRVLGAVDVPVQFGGGIRAIEDIEQILELGIDRVILGTVAVREPEIVRQSVAEFGSDRIAVGIDARDGMVAVEGWTAISQVRAVDLGRQMRMMGVTRVIYTDISRDGMLSGVNVQSTAELAQSTGLGVIASGGVATLDDIRALVAQSDQGIEGVIIGMALYRSAFTLQDALKIASEEVD